MENRLPAVPKPTVYFTIPAWILFAIGQATLLLALFTLASDSQSWIAIRFKNWLVLYYLIAALLIVFASIATYWAANRFNSRLAYIIQCLNLQLSELRTSSPQPFKGKFRNLTVAHLTDLRPHGDTPASALKVYAKGYYLPVPYNDLSEGHLSWEIPRYLELLTEERASARREMARIAGALGGTFAALMIASVRLVQHFG